MLPPIPPRTADAADAFNNPRRDRLISFLSRRPLLSLRDAESLGSVSWLNPIRTEARKVICDLALGVDIAALGYGGNSSIWRSCGRSRERALRRIEPMPIDAAQ